MKHRHLEVAPGKSIEDLPAAVVADLLERGDLGDWRPIAAAIAKDPACELAGRVLRLVDAYPMYGTSALWRAWIERRRDLAEGRQPEPATTPPSSLGAVRRELGLTQVEIAARMQISQSDLSKLERRADLRFSTLRSFASALGARLRVLLCHPDGSQREVRLSGSDRHDDGG